MSVLSGFTITGGVGQGGGIQIDNSSPTVSNNVIIGNYGSGAGIGILDGSPTISGNTITNNVKFEAGGGGGIYISGTGAAQIISNTITNNIRDSGSGIAVFATGSPLIMDNYISGNLATGLYGCSPGLPCLTDDYISEGGGIWVQEAMPSIIQNLIVNNTADVGGGVFVWEPSGFGAGATLLVNNTIANNFSTQGYGSALVGVNFGPGSEIVNNVLVGLQSQNAFYCDLSNPVFTNNDVFSANGVPLIGNCSAIAGSPSNISLDPRFAGASDNNYYLLAGSSAIGSGSVAAPELPSSDFYGNPRITTGVPGCPAIVNMGVSQFQEGVVDSQCPSPPAKPQKLKVSAQSLGFRATTRNSLSRARSITIANPRKNRPADIVLASYGSFADDFLAGNYCPEKLAAGAKCTIFEAFRPTSVSPESAQLLIMDGSDTPIATVNLSGSGLSPGAR